jgi:hypothetical protein
VGRRERQLLIVSAGLGALLLIATCTFLGIMALTLRNADGFGFLARATQTPTPTITPLPTEVVIPTDTPTLTPSPTSTPTPTETPSPTPWPTWTPGSVWDSPIATSAPYATPTWRPTTPYRPPATSTPYRTSTPSRTVTAGTPTATLTRTATVIPPANCRSDDTMTFTPASPAQGQAFTIVVRSEAGYVDVSLLASAGGSPTYKGVSLCDGGYHCWTWEHSQADGGVYTYSFKIRAGYATCISKSVTVTAPTDTPTVTPTPTRTPTATPYYGFDVYTVGPVLQSVFPGEWVIPFELGLRHLGNRDDNYSIWAEETVPASWTVQYCINSTDICFSPNDRQTVTLHPGDPDLPLYIKVRVGDDAQSGDNEIIVLKAQSLTTLLVKEKAVAVNVK